MRQTIEATIDEQGNVRLLQPIQLSKPRRAYVTILDDERDIPETALLSEAALAEDWNRPEEDAAWSHLNPAPVRVDWSQVRSVVEAAASELNWNVEISIDTAENLIVVVCARRPGRHDSGDDFRFLFFDCKAIGYRGL